jgi:hypothetical protein
MSFFFYIRNKNKMGGTRKVTTPGSTTHTTAAPTVPKRLDLEPWESTKYGRLFNAMQEEKLLNSSKDRTTTMLFPRGKKSIEGEPTHVQVKVNPKTNRKVYILHGKAKTDGSNLTKFISETDSHHFKGGSGFLVGRSGFL